MATQTVEDLQIKIGSDIKQALSGMNVVQKRLDQLKAQLEKGFAPKMDAMKAAMQNLSVPLEKTAQAVKKSANQIAKEQANLQSKLQIIEEKAQAQIATALLKEEAKRIKAQEIINKQADAQRRLAEVSKAAADSIIQQQNDITAAVQRTTDKMQQQATGGFYKQKTVPRTGAKLATQMLPPEAAPQPALSFIDANREKILAFSAAIKEAMAKAEETVKRVNIDEVTAKMEQFKIASNSAMENLSIKIGLVKGKIQELLAQYQATASKLGTGSAEAIGIESQIARANTELQRLKASMEKAEVSTKKYGDTVKTIFSRVGEAFSSIGNVVKSAMSKAINAFSKFGNAVKKTTADAGGFFSKLGNIIKRVLVIGVLYKAFRGLFSFITNGIKNAISAPEIENMFNVAFGAAAASADEFAKKLKKAFGVDVMASKQMLATFQNFNVSMGIGTNTAATMSKSLTQLAYDMASLYEANPQQVFENLQSGLQGMPRALYKYGIAITDANIQQTALKNGLVQQGQEMTSQQKVLARYMTILEMTKTSQGDLAKTIQSPANQLRILKSQLDAAGRAIGQAFMPFIQAVLPWLNAFAVVLERVGNVLSRFTFKLFGKDFDAEMKAKQDALKNLQNSAAGAAGAEGDLGDATEEAGKKAKGAVAPFDQLNVLQDKAGDTAGAGEGLEFPVPEMPEPTGESPFEKMADQIQDFFKKYSFMDIGKIISEKLNTAIASVNWYELGSKIGAFLQNAIEFAYGLIANFDFGRLGASIGNSIMGIFDTIDFSLLGATIAEWANGVFTFFYEAFVAIDWSAIGTYLSNAFMGFFNTVDLNMVASAISTLINGLVNLVYEFVTKTDWSKVAIQIGEAINSFFNNIDWAKLGATIGAFFDKLVTFMLDLVKTIDWGQIGTAIMTAFDNMGTDAKMFLGIVVGFGLVGKAIETVVKILGSIGKAAEGWKAISPIISGAFSGLTTKILPAIQTALTWITATAIPSISTVFATVGTAISGAATAVAAFFGISVGWLVAIVAAVIAVVVAVVVYWDEIKAFFTTTLPAWWNGTVVPFFQNMWESLVSGVKGAIEKVKEGWNSFVEFFKTLPVKIGVIVGKITGFLVDFVTITIPKWFNSVKEWFAKVAQTIKDSFTNALATIKQWGVDVWNFISVEIPKWIVSIATWFSELPEKIWLWLVSAYEKVKQWGKDLIVWASTAIPQFVTDVIDFLKELPTKALQVGKDLVTELWNGIKSMISWIGNKISDFVDWLFGGFKKGFEIGFNERSSGSGRSYSTQSNYGGYSVARSMPVPKLAQGAVLRRSTLVNVAEYAGAASNPEIVSPQNIMYETAVEANAPLVSALLQKLDQVIKAIQQIDPSIIIGDDEIHASWQRENARRGKMVGAT